MTKLRDINSTIHVEKDLHGNVIHTVRDSLVAESLLSVIMCITILSVMLIIKCYVQIIEVSILPPFVTLIVPVLHTVIRRIRINPANASRSAKKLRRIRSAGEKS